jgi:hypothetical protein
LEHRASVKRFVSLQFLNSNTIGRTPWMGYQPVARPLPTQTQNKQRTTSMPWVGLEPTIPAFERANTVHVLDCAATTIGASYLQAQKLNTMWKTTFLPVVLHECETWPLAVRKEREWECLRREFWHKTEAVIGSSRKQHAEETYNLYQILLQEWTQGK